MCFFQHHWVQVEPGIGLLESLDQARQVRPRFRTFFSGSVFECIQGYFLSLEARYRMLMSRFNEGSAVSETSNSIPESIDICVVGGGIAGILAAVRSARSNPQKKVTLFEKSGFLGGRQSPYRKPEEVIGASPSGQRAFRGYGLQIIPGDVFELLCSEIAGRDEKLLAELKEFSRPLGSEVGVVAAGKQTTVLREDLFSAAGFRAVGGPAAQKEWPVFEAMTEKNLTLEQDKLKDRSFAKVWDKGKKSAGSIVLAQYARLLGMADHWTSHLESLRQRIAGFGQEHVVISSGFFEKLETLLSVEDSSENSLVPNLHVKLASPILRANFQNQYLSPKQQVEKLYPEGIVAYTEAMAAGDDEDASKAPESKDESPESWHLATRKQSFSAEKLIVACSLWNTKSWLPKKYLPNELIQIAVKSLPVSLVVSHKVALADLPDEMLDLTIVPAENVQIWKLSKRHIYCQVAVSYEQSIQAKPVVNAIRKIRRSLRKLKEVYPQLEWQDEEHVALVSNGFEVDASAEFYSEVLEVNGAVQLNHLGFVGANFGPTYDGYSNLKYSIDAVGA